jgi:hypothetical protein
MMFLAFGFFVSGMALLLANGNPTLQVWGVVCIFAALAVTGLANKK